MRAKRYFIIGSRQGSAAECPHCLHWLLTYWQNGIDLYETRCPHCRREVTVDPYGRRKRGIQNGTGRAIACRMQDTPYRARPAMGSQWEESNAGRRLKCPGDA